MGKLYILSDIHFGVRNNAIAWKDMMVEYFDWYINTTKSEGRTHNDELIILGDIFNSRESINIMILENILGVFKKLSSEFSHITILTGNHDCYYLDSNEITSVELLKSFDNITCIKDPETKMFNGKQLMLLPWNHDFNEINQILEKDNSDYLFCHMDINGMSYTNGQTVKNSADRAILHKYKKIYSGHIHLRQSNGNVVYVGTPYQLDWGDVNNIPGYYYLDEQFEEHFTENTFSPRFKKISINDILDHDIEYVSNLLKNSYVYAKCDKNAYLNLNLIQFRTQLLELGINFKKLDFYQELDTTTDITTETITLNTSFNIKDEITKLLEAKKLSSTEITKRLEYFDSIYNKTRQEYGEGE